MKSAPTKNAASPITGAKLFAGSTVMTDTPTPAPAPMTARLRELMEKATRGEWENRGYGHISAHLPQSYEAPGFTVTTSLTPLLRLPEGIAAGNWKNDADLIVYLKNNAPTLLRLLEAVEGAEKVGANILAKLDSETASVTQWDADELRAALATLRAAREGAR